MPTLKHELIVDLFRGRPTLAPDLLEHTRVTHCRSSTGRRWAARGQAQTAHLAGVRWHTVRTVEVPRVPAGGMPGQQGDHVVCGTDRVRGSTTFHARAGRPGHAG